MSNCYMCQYIDDNYSTIFGECYDCSHDPKPENYEEIVCEDDECQFFKRKEK